jgi:serine/tyrosine/threonine adenylyltransferase
MANTPSDAAPMIAVPAIAFDNSYARLPDRFYARQAPTPVARPQLIRVNPALAEALGLDPAWLASPAGVAILAGNQIADRSEPIAMAYAGHQFGGFSPQLGDGRAILLGEVIDRDGNRRDLQLKGAGPTPYSRRGDGRAAIGPVLREYVVSEAMAALGIPTTRALAAVTTGEMVRRETALPGAVLTRVAASHIRVGTFQFFAARGDVDGVRTLADHVIARHYPEAVEADNRYRALFEAVMARQAALIARWLGVGFIHGVMNTDNMAISGETIDYGPCAFMDTFDPATVYSFIDEQGRYAYDNQPRIAQWNLARLVETLLPLLDEDETAARAQAQVMIDAFGSLFQAAYATEMRRKLGLVTSQPDDVQLAQDLLARMAKNHADFTLTFRALGHAAAGPAADAAACTLFDQPADFTTWADQWRARLADEPVGAEGAVRMRLDAANPAYIPRNHLVEAMITAAVSERNFAPFGALHAVLAAPFTDQPGAERFALPPRPEEVVRNTFCGT